MTLKRNDTYVKTFDENGENVLCPVGTVKDGKAVDEDNRNECFEKDVAERYAGNIDIHTAL
jgi:hypothetical protein